MSRVRLGDIVSRIKDFEDKDTSDLKYYVGGEHFDNRSLTVNRKGIIKGSTIGPAFHTKFKSGDVLLMSRNPHLRKAGLVDFDGICSDVSYIIRTKDEKVIKQRFIPLLFQSDIFWNFAERNKKGSTNFFLNWSDFEKFEFDLPSITEQEKLCEVLWAIDDTLKSYQEQIKQCDELVKGQFVEMFGKCKRTVLVKDCCTYHSRIGWQALTTKEHQSTGEYLLITGTDFIDNRINYDTCVYVSKERYDMDIKLQIKNGDILITKDGTIGKVAVVDDLPMSATLNAGIFVVRPDKRFFKEYIEYVFKGDLFQQFIEKSKTGATIKHLNQNKLENFEIILPEISKQKEFAELYKHLDKSKFAIKVAMNNAQKIFDGILKENLK